VCVCVCVCTGVVGERLGGPVSTRGDEVPDEALDVLVSAVVQQAVGQQRPADRLHVRLLQGPLEAPVSQDVAPPAPPTRQTHRQPIAPRTEHTAATRNIRRANVAQLGLFGQRRRREVKQRRSEQRL